MSVLDNEDLADPSVHEPKVTGAAQPPREPVQPLSDEDIAQLWSPHPGGEVRRPILGWGKVCDFARAIERLITERMSTPTTKEQES